MGFPLGGKGRGGAVDNEASHAGAERQRKSAPLPPAVVEAVKRASRDDAAGLPSSVRSQLPDEEFLRKNIFLTVQTNLHNMENTTTKKITAARVCVLHPTHNSAFAFIPLYPSPHL